MPQSASRRDHIRMSSEFTLFLNTFTTHIHIILKHIFHKSARKVLQCMKDFRMDFARGFKRTTHMALQTIMSRTKNKRINNDPARDFSSKLANCSTAQLANRLHATIQKWLRNKQKQQLHTYSKTESVLLSHKKKVKNSPKSSRRSSAWIERQSSSRKNIHRLKITPHTSS